MIKEQALSGKIISAPLNGSPVAIQELPDDFAPFYSGAVLILAPEQPDKGDANQNIKTEFGLRILTDAVVLSQKTWHDIKGA